MELKINISSEFYKSHPNIFAACETLKKMEITLDLKIRAVKQGETIKRKHEREREIWLLKTFAEYKNKKIDQLQYLKCLGYKFQGFKFE